MKADRKATYRRVGRRLRGARLRYLRWQNAHIPQSVVLIMIATITGVLIGVGAAAIKSLISGISRLLLKDFRPDVPDYRLLIWPLAGILLTSIFQRYVVRGSVARGTRIIRQDLDKGRFKLSPFTIFNPLIGCSMTIGFGSSAGSEGPTALSGAAIGSAVGRWFGLSKSWLRLLVGIGGGAGIAAIFKAPVGGVLFTLEVLQMELTTLPVIALIIACLVSSSTAYMLSDFTFDIFFDKAVAFDKHAIWWVMLLGLFCGLYSIYYNLTKSRATKIFQSIRNPWVGVLVTGGLMSVCVFLFPGLYGEGFGVITNMVNGMDFSLTAGGLFAAKSGVKWVMIALVAVLLLKSILVPAAYCGGGVAGDFVPTFFAGALAGFLFATGCNSLLGSHLPVWFFALTGMGCVMAGTVHAPLMAVFILCETTNTYGYIFPYLVAVAISYATVKIITPRSWDDETGHDDMIALLSHREEPTLRSRVRSLKTEKTAGTNEGQSGTAEETAVKTSGSTK